MKRERHEHRPLHDRHPDGGGGYPPMMATRGKYEISESVDVGMDELLQALGYNVRSSEMSEVAQKLEQLEMVIGNAQEDGISQLSSGTVHYNPSDIAQWVESMLTELTPVSPNLDVTAKTPMANSIWISKTESLSSDVNAEETTVLKQPGSPLEEHFHDDEGIEGVVYGRRREKKRSKYLPVPVTAENAPEARPMVVVDSEEKGIRLVHALIACAEAVQEDNLQMADMQLKQIDALAASLEGSAMRKVATFFAEALARRIYKLDYPAANDNFSDLLQMHFYEACPYLKFAHFTANQAILEAFSGCSRVHVIDFGMKQGMQWPALMQALAVRSPDGCRPPAFRLTGIGPLQADGSDPLQQVGMKLAQFAETINMEFQYRGFVASSLADIEAYMLDIRPPDLEAVAVNSIFELHRVLSQPDDIDRVLSLIRDVRPRIVTVVEQEANHNEPVFLDRFTEALHYYSSLFDSLEGCAAESQDMAMAEVYLGREICNVVAVEDGDRVERHETLARWRARMSAAGFTAVHLGSNAFKQASMLLALFTGSDGYRVEENNGCLTLGWHTRSLIATSAWKLLPPSSSSQFFGAIWDCAVASASIRA